MRTGSPGTVRPSGPMAEPLRFEDFHAHLPTGPRSGVAPDADKLRDRARKARVQKARVQKD